MRISIAVFLVGAASTSFTAASPVKTNTELNAAADALRPLYTPPNVWAKVNKDEFIAFEEDHQDNSHVIPDSYIVVLKESHGHHLPLHLDQLSKLFGGSIKHTFSIGEGLSGYAATLNGAVLDWVRRHPAVDFIEKDTVVRANDLEKGAPWGLARISHRPTLRLGTLGRYEYAHDGGRGVDVYVIDTGVNINHVELEGRAKWGKTMPLNDQDIDGNGHGSHVAGTIASAKYGVAKDANIIAVKVLGTSGSGSMSDVVGGVAWAANAAAQKVKSEEARNGTHKGSVANMSLGGGKSPALDLAVNNAVKKGLHFAVAAGNDNRDACSYSPAGAENAITVGASTIGDARAYFSNWGKCVDIFAPGLNILSIWNTGNRSINTISGTSMASPHIAGLAAYYLSLYGEKDGFRPAKEDYEAAGVQYVDVDKVATKDRSLFQTGRQLVFGKLFGSSSNDEVSAYRALDPKVLKQSMLRLSTKDALSGLPSDTVNYLAFNNFTAPSSIMQSIPEVDIVEEELYHFQPVLGHENIMASVQDAMKEFEKLVEEVVVDELAWLESPRK